MQNGGPKSPARNQLFRQLPGGKFQDVSKGSGLDINGYNMGVAVADVNNDGWLDVLVTQYSGLKLFLNQGNGTFVDVTEKSGLSNPAWGSSAAFFDYDRDGWLDLVVVSYVDYTPNVVCSGQNQGRDFCTPKAYRDRVSRLFHNEGRGMRGKGRGGRHATVDVPASKVPASPAPRPSPLVPRFEDVTVPSGLGRVPGPGLGVICADFDGDGWPDIFIANDTKPNRLWMNRHNGTFSEEAVTRNIAYNSAGLAQAGMGIALGDVDEDGLFDIFNDHLSEETHTLWQQKPRGLFLDRTARSGLLDSHWHGTGFGTLFGDFDQDGHLDLAIVNGRIAAAAKPCDDSLGPFWSYYGERNQLFAGDGAGKFRDVSLDNPPFCGRYNVARGLVRGDFDGDGALDLLVTTVAGRARLYRNVAPDRGHWLKVEAHDPKWKRDALGAEIRVRAGKRSWTGWLVPSESYLSSNEPRVHFGLGSVDRLDRIEVRWPDGAWEEFPGGAVDQALKLEKGKGRLLAP